MLTACTTADALRFPDRCVRCDARPDCTHRITATRGIDLIVVAAWEAIDVPVPLCAPCRRHRRRRGLALYGGAILLSVSAVVAAVVFSRAGQSIAAGAVVVLLGGLMLGLKWRGRLWLERSAVGLRIDLLKGDHVPLRLAFERDAYFRAWQAVNPTATSTIQPPPTERSRELAEPASPAELSRRTPLALLAFCAIATIAHDANAKSSGEIYPMLVLVMSSIGALALAGCWSPAVFYAVGRRGRHLPAGYRVLAGLAWSAGFALGMYALFTAYG